MNVFLFVVAKNQFGVMVECKVHQGWASGCRKDAELQKDVNVAAGIG